MPKKKVDQPRPSSVAVFNFRLSKASYMGETQSSTSSTTSKRVPNVNLTNGNKETALYCVAQYGHLECVEQLLDAGAEPYIKSIREETALDHADAR